MTDASIPAAVSLRQLEKYYGGYHALRSIDLDIAPRQRVVICGPSGSGKSTLIRCMNMLEAPDAGEVLIEGVRINRVSRDAAAALRAVGMVRAQVRRSIYLESVFIAIYGALVGVVIGVVVACPI